MPADTLGADLIWWRGGQGWSTTVTLLWGCVQEFPDTVHVQARLFDPAGGCVAGWRLELPTGRPVFIDSATPGPWSACPDGVLALYACTDGASSEAARRHFQRLYPLVDWHGPRGEFAMLHSDQVIRRGRDVTQCITEIAVRESANETNALVVLNGEQLQGPGALKLDIRNARGETREVRHAPGMTPFSVNRIGIRDLMPDVVDFAHGESVMVSAAFESRGLYTRPYVETTGARYGVHHAGDVYQWAALPYFAHALIGGEVNPAAVIHDANTRTIVHLLHSHGDLEDDVAVDARLYDLDGRCVAHRPAWRIARRHALASADVAELLTDSAASFRGHVALCFSVPAGRPAPRRLQALIEYRSARGVARVMTWSDEWNSLVRLARRDRMAGPVPIQSYCRVLARGGWSTEVAITHAGHPGYARQATVHLELFDANGPVAHARFELAPFATRFAPMRELFPGLGDLLGLSGLGLLVVTSESDLANMAFSRSTSDGTLAAEHFMPLLARTDAGDCVAAAGR